MLECISICASYYNLKNLAGCTDKQNCIDVDHTPTAKRKRTLKEETKTKENANEDNPKYSCVVHEAGNIEDKEDLYTVPVGVMNEHIGEEQTIWLEGEPTAKAVTVKSDKAKVPVHLWNNRIIKKLEEEWDSTSFTTVKCVNSSSDVTSVNFDK